MKMKGPYYQCFPHFWGNKGTELLIQWMMRNFFADIPQSLEESTLIDVCSRFQAFYKISLPLVIPGIASVGIYTFIFSWSELMFSLSYLTSPSKQIAPIFSFTFYWSVSNQMESTFCWFSSSCLANYDCLRFSPEILY